MFIVVMLNVSGSLNVIFLPRRLPQLALASSTASVVNGVALAKLALRANTDMTVAQVTCKLYILLYQLLT